MLISQKGSRSPIPAIATNLLVRILGVLHADPRVRSAWLGGCLGRREMKMTNDSYGVAFPKAKRTTERYYRDKAGWLKVSARGRVFRMTAASDTYCTSSMVACSWARASCRAIASRPELTSSSALHPAAHAGS